MILAAVIKKLFELGFCPNNLHGRRHLEHTKPNQTGILLFQQIFCFRYVRKSFPCWLLILANLNSLPNLAHLLPSTFRCWFRHLHSFSDSFSSKIIAVCPQTQVTIPEFFLSHICPAPFHRLILQNRGDRKCHNPSKQFHGLQLLCKHF